MNYARGVLLWLGSDALGSTKTVTVGFQPKALKFTGVTPANTFDLNDFVSNIPSSWWSFGFASSPSNRRCVATFDDNGAGSAICSSAFRDDCIAIEISLTTPTTIAGLLDLDAILSDGFRLIVDDAASNGLVIMWEAWGGDDITVAEAISIAEPAATGNQDYTVTGFTSDGVGQAVMFAGVQQTGASPAVGRTDSGRCVGFASGTLAANNAVVMGNSDDGSATMDTDGYCKTGECLGMIALAGGNPSARAQLTQWNANGFRLNWIARATTNRRYIALAIKGGLWQAGAYTIDGSTLNATATVSGLAFQPLGVDLIGRMTVEQAAGTSTVQDRVAVGSASSPSARNTFGILSENGVGNTEIDTIREYDQLLAFPSTTGTIQSLYDLNAINSDGFQTIVDTAGGVASEWHGYLTFGSAAAPFIDLTRDEAIPVESLRSLLLTIGIPLESLRQLLTLTGIPVESLISFLAGTTIPLESLLTHGRIDEIPVESSASVVAISRDDTIPIDSTVSLVRDATIPIDVLGSLLRSETIPIESLRALFSDEQIPVDVQAALLRNGETIPIESLRSLLRDETIPIDVLGVVLRNGEIIPIDVLGALARDEEIPIDVLGSLLRDEEIPVESSQVVMLQRDDTIPIDTLGTLARLASIPVDVLGAVLRDGSTIPVETLAALLQDITIPIDVLRALLRESIIPIDSTGAVVIQRARDEDIPIDVSGSLLRDDEIPIDAQGNLVRDATIPVEAIGTVQARDEEIPIDSVTIIALVRDDAIPVDSIGTQVFALDRDETIPIDASTVPVAPGEFLVFTPGSPWPPSWLVRAPLLNRTQHHAVLYLGGTSWSTFTGSEASSQPSTLVKPVKPKRIKKPRPQPAHPGYVRAAHTSIIWVGGRSTEATRIDPLTVKQQDEDDIMSLLPLL